jgi:predicted RNA binding protein YcfA (HicA-like mRNA interferase family)
MTRLPRDLSGADLRRVLEKSGFVLVRMKGSHMMFRRQSTATLVVVPNHRVIKPSTLRSIMHTAGISSDELVELMR